MSSEDRNGKRRRVNDDNDKNNHEEADEVPSAPPAVVSISAATTEHPVTLTVPILEAIPNFLVEIQSDNEEEASSALEALRQLMRSENLDATANRKEALSCGAHAILVPTMRKWQHNRDFQTFGSHCVQAVAQTNRQSAIVITKMGGVEAILDALKIFSGEIELQKRATAALVNVFVAMPNSEVIQNAADRFVNEMDGVSTVTKAMKDFPDIVAYQNYTAMLFGNLATSQEL